MNIKIVESMARLYADGIKQKDEFIKRVVEGVLTPEEYNTITGEDYKG